MERLSSGMPRFELHSHSHYSKGTTILAEGISSPSEMIREAKRLGLSGLALTDHNCIKGWKEAKTEARKQGLIFIPGCEITTASGHVVAIGMNDAIKSGLSVEETVDLVRRQGGMAIAAHPFDIKGEGIKEEFIKVDAVEVLNGLNSRMSDGVAKRHARRTCMPFTGGSDAHTLEMLGNVQNLIDADCADSLISRIKKGRVIITGHPATLGALVRWTRQRMTLSNEDVNAYINDNYFMLRAWASRRLLEKFVRSDSNKWEMVAWIGLFFSTYYAAASTVYEELFLRYRRYDESFMRGP